MGKKITFAGFILALLCLVPAAISTLIGGEGVAPTPGIIAVVGFPLFSLVSFIGMLLWIIAEIRAAKTENNNRDR